MSERAHSAEHLRRGVLARWWARHFSGINRYEAWGFAVWGAMGAVIAVPEIWAAVDSHLGWPTISGTIGAGLEYKHNWVAIIVVAVIAFAAFHALYYPALERGKLRERADKRRIGRTREGRLAVAPPGESDEGFRKLDRDEISAFQYFAVATVVVIAGSALTAALTSDRYILGYVLYGLLGTFWIVVPNVAAYAAKKDIAFPTLFRTVHDLERRLRGVAVVVAGGLVVLVIHLTLYPWPAIIPDLQKLHTQNQKQHHQPPRPPASAP
jgi:hypothetical protein